MTTLTQKKKLSKGTWALIIVIFAAIIAVVVMAALGYIDLTPYTDMYVGVFMWGSIGIFNALILTAGIFAAGFGGCWIIINYFKGQQVVTNAVNNYTGQSTISQPPAQQGTETVVS